MRAPEGGGPTRMHILIAGGGVAALEAVLALRALAEDRVSIELVTPEEYFTYRPLAVAEPFGVGEVKSFPLRALTEAAGARFRSGLVAAVDPERHVVASQDGEELAYDLLLLALGAKPREAVPNALTFRGPEDGPAIAALLDEALAGEVRSIAFALPAGASWPLPLYELALLTGNFLTDRGTRGVAVKLVTPEESPLAIFGAEARDAIRELLERRGIELRLRTTPLSVDEGGLRVAPDGVVEAERVVALPRLEGPWIPGIPSDAHGFVPTDEFGRVGSQEDVYAAGDVTQFPLKQGGIATQQADAAAAAIAARAGAPVEPVPFKPVLCGLLLTGMTPRYLRAEAGTARSAVDAEALWWPPAKIVGRYLAPFLATHLGTAQTQPEPSDAVPVEVEFDPNEDGFWSRI